MSPAGSSSSSSSSSSFSWTAPRDAAAEADLSSDDDDEDVNRSERGGGGIDAEAERKQLAAVRDFKGKTMRTQEEEKRKLAAEPKSKIESDDAVRALLEELRKSEQTLRMLTSFKVGGVREHFRNQELDLCTHSLSLFSRRTTLSNASSASRMPER